MHEERETDPTLLLREHSTAEYRRSVRDVIWYGGQVAVITLAYQDRPRVLYLFVAALAGLITIVTAVDLVRWRRVLRGGGDVHAGAGDGGPGARRPGAAPQREDDLTRHHFSPARTEP